MRRFLAPQVIVLVIACACLVALAIAGHQYRFYERGWFNWNQWLNGTNESAMDLSRYQVTIDAKVLEGLENVSALTFDPQRRTLFTLTNKHSEVIELSLTGDILRRIPMVGFGDPEAIEYISPGVYVVSDESQQRLIKIHIDDATTALDATSAEQISLALEPGRNRSFEGLAYDSAGQRLFVAKESNPMLIYEVQGFPYARSASPAVRISGDSARDARLFVRDLSSLHYDAGSGHLLALSDQSRLVLELDLDGRPTSSLSLNRGFQGLRADVPQAEGISMDDEGSLYIVSEPNLFYRFSVP